MKALPLFKVLSYTNGDVLNRPKVEDKSKDKKKLEDDDYMECYPR